MKVTILESPFALLGASIRDGRDRLNELMDEKELLPEADLCRQARTTLTHPKMRLRAEIGWFLGISPQKAFLLLDLIKAKDTHNLSTAGLPPLSAVNVIFSQIELLDEPYQIDLIAQMVRDLSIHFSEIIVADLLSEINDERAISGFPIVQSLDHIIEEINSLKKHYSKVISGITLKLDSSDSLKLVSLLSDFQNDLPTETDISFFNEIFSAYDLSLANFYEKFESEINLTISEITSDKSISVASRANSIAKLEKQLENFFKITNPLQIRLSSQGMDHQKSYDIGIACRSLSIDLFNETGDEKSSKAVQSLLLNYFQDVPTVIELTNKDVVDMEEIKIDRLASIIRCELCQEITPHLRVTVFYRVWSLIFFSRMLPTAGIFCEQCRSTLAWKNATFSALLGPWGLPWGVFYTIRSLYVAAIGGSMPRSENAALLRSQGSAFLRNDMINAAFTNLKNSLAYEKSDDVKEVIAENIFSNAKLLPASKFLKGQAIALSYVVALTIFAFLLFASFGETSSHTDTASNLQSSQNTQDTNDESTEKFNQDWKKIKPVMQACKIGKNTDPLTYTSCQEYLSKVRAIKKNYSGENLDLLQFSEDVGNIWLAEADHAQSQKLDDAGLYKNALADLHNLSLHASTKEFRTYVTGVYNCFSTNKCPTQPPN